MSVLKKKLRIYDHSNPNNYTDIDDDSMVNAKISEGRKGSGMEITLKNPINTYDGTYTYGKHVTEGEFIFKEKDTVKLWVKYVDDDTEIDTDESDDLILVTEITETSALLAENKTEWTLKCVDSTYLLLNRLWAYNYKESLEYTAPQIIQHIINITSTEGTSIWGKVNAILESNGGCIEDIRPNGSAFPIASIAHVFKPVYQWIDELSQPDYTNTSTEIDSDPPCPLPFFFYIDEDGKCHWEYPTSTTTHTMTIGDTDSSHIIRGFKLTRGTFDVINFVIFNVGKDFYGSGILSYFYDDTTTSPDLKPVFRPWIDIADKLMEKAIKEENSASFSEDNATPGTLTWHDKRYTASYNFTPHWTTTAVTSDSTLNISLRNAAKDAGKAKAREMTKGYGSPRWRGTIKLKGYKYNIGELITFNSHEHGILNAKIRITDVQHNITTSGWFTTISVKEDPEPINP